MKRLSNRLEEQYGKSVDDIVRDAELGLTKDESSRFSVYMDHMNAEARAKRRALADIERVRMLMKRYNKYRGAPINEFKKGAR